jgi:hypothetical protein
LKLLIQQIYIFYKAKPHCHIFQQLREATSYKGPTKPLRSSVESWYHPSVNTFISLHPSWNHPSINTFISLCKKKLITDVSRLISQTRVYASPIRRLWLPLTKDA